jgi:hypothetical protein
VGMVSMGFPSCWADSSYFSHSTIFPSMLQVFFWLTFVHGVGILYLNLTLKIRFEMKDTYRHNDTGPDGAR